MTSSHAPDVPRNREPWKQLPKNTDNLNGAERNKYNQMAGGCWLKTEKIKAGPHSFLFTLGSELDHAALGGKL